MRYQGLLALALLAAACDTSVDVETARSASVNADPPFIAFAVAGTDRHACAIVPGNTAQCWGSSFGTTPQRLPGATVRLETVEVGQTHSCGLDRDGAAWCWGDNKWGQLGSGNLLASATPAKVAGDLRFIALSAGGSTSCGLTAEGRAHCWGLGQFGRLGAVTTERCTGNQLCSTTPIAVQGGHVFRQISVGLLSACALSESDQAYCWGSNAFRAIGSGGTLSSYSSPQPVAGGRTFASVSVGSVHVCALEADGAAWCWGLNAFGALGRGGAGDSGVPVAVTGGVRFASIRASGGNVIFNHTCGIATSGETYCWGANSNGQLAMESTGLATCTLGRFSQPCAREPRPAATELEFEYLRAGFEYTCGVARMQLYCWGSNQFGALGNPDVALNTHQPTPVSTWQKGPAAPGHRPVDPAIQVVD